MDSIEIRLIRNTNTRNDDYIAFRRRMVGGFLLRYQDGQNNAVWVNDKTPEQVCDYIENLLSFVTLDDDPYTNIQFTIPGHPIIYLKPSDMLEDVIESILQTVYEYVYHPPLPIS
jgi:hypothetical protein